MSNNSNNKNSGGSNESQGELEPTPELKELSSEGQDPGNEEIEELDLSLVEVDLEPVDEEDKSAKTQAGESADAGSGEKAGGVSEKDGQVIAGIVRKKVHQAVQEALDKAVQDMDEHINMHKKELKSLSQEFSDSLKGVEKNISTLLKQKKTHMQATTYRDKSLSGAVFNWLKIPLALGAGFLGAILVYKFYPQVFLDVLHFLEKWI